MRKNRKAETSQPLLPEAVIQSRIKKISSARTVRSFLFKLAAVAAVVWAALSMLFGIAVMRGEGMYPRLRDGDLLFYYRLSSAYYIGDIVTFTDGSGQRQVGRIIARSGDVVDMTEAGELLVNENVQTEEIFYLTEKDGAAISFPYTVEENSVFLLCDMRTTGYDSRQYGGVPLDRLDGKIITALRRRGL